MQNIDYDISDRYQSASATFSLHGIDTTAAEAHGIVCGLIIASGRVVADNAAAPTLDKVNAPYHVQWLHVITGDSPSPAAPDRLLDLVADMHVELSKGLLSDDYTLRLLLPGQSAPLHERAEALVAWCQGLLLGLMRERTVDIKTLPDDVPEIISDIMAIAESDLGDDDVEDDNDGERSLMEIEEYVRVGVRVLFEELVVGAASTSGHSPSDQLH